MTRTFLRPGSIEIYGSVEGNGHKPQVEHYRFQGLDLNTELYLSNGWFGLAKLSAVNAQITGMPIPDLGRAGNWKYAGRCTPLGTSVATLAREGHDMLAAPCGYCGVNMARCACGSAKEA